MASFKYRLRSEACTDGSGTGPPALSFLQAIKTNTPDIIYNLGSGVGTSLNEILQLIGQKFNYNLNIEYLPGRNFDVPENVLDVNLLRSNFTINSFTTLADGLEKFHNFLLLNK